MSLSRRHSGFTFVELIAAIALLAITIVPATQYFANSMKLRRELERDRAMVVLATQLAEAQMGAVYGSFTTADIVDTFASQGLSDVAYRISRSDSASYGGIPDTLMAIRVRVWTDDDGDLVLDANEAKVELYTKMARSVEN